MEVVTVFGGSGFLGRYVVRQLASQGLFIRVIVRNPNEALFLRVYGKVGQIQLIGGDIKEELKIHEHIKGSSCVINCVATFFETRLQSFNVLHVNAARTWLKLQKKRGKSIHSYIISWRINRINQSTPKV